MIKATCISKERDKTNKIIKYTLRDNSGKTVIVSPEKLKEAIKKNKIHITNLTLTSDNRLIRKWGNNNDNINIKNEQTSVEKEQLSELERANILIMKCKVLGVERDFTCLGGHYKIENGEVVLMKCDVINGVFNIPYWVTRAYHADIGSIYHSAFEDCIDIKVTGKIKDAKNLFMKCNKLKRVDIEELDLSENDSIESMFYGCTSLEEVKWSNINTSKIVNMKCLFYNCINNKEHRFKCT